MYEIFRKTRQNGKALWMILLLLLAGLSLVFADRLIAVATLDLPIGIRTAALYLSESTDPKVVLPFLVCCAIAQAYQRRSTMGGMAELPSVAILCCGAAAVVGSLVLKNVIGRARPGPGYDWNPWISKPLSFAEPFASMPSSQSALAAAATCAVVSFFPRYRIPALIGGMLVCISRVLVGEHWASDVLSGWALGWVIASTVSHRFFCADRK